MRAVILLLLSPLAARAGPCDQFWDGAELAQQVQGRDAAATVHLVDSDHHPMAELSAAQVLAVTEANEAIAAKLGRAPTLLFCNDRAPNAFALRTPQGDVAGVTLGMARLADGDRDMAAMVIGHEYAHLVLGHIERAERRAQLKATLLVVADLALTFGARGNSRSAQLGASAGLVATALLAHKFDRDEERQADETGFDYLVDAGFNPLGAVRLAEAFQRRGAGGSGLFFDNHPGWPERTARLRALIQASPAARDIIAHTGTRTVLAATSATGSKASVELAPVFETSNAQQTLSEGLAAYAREDYPPAVASIRSAAAAGYPPAQTMLGYLYEGGRAGLPRDEVEAARLYQLGVAQANGTAMNNLASFYLAGRGGLAIDGKKAIDLYLEAAAHGLPRALTRLGDTYYHGRPAAGIEKDEAAGRRYFEQGAAAGDAEADFSLGVLYQLGGAGLEKDEPKAVELYRRAAEHGSANGQYSLGRAYLFGIGGLPKDEAEGVRLIQLAAARGVADAQDTLGVLFAYGRSGLPKDEVRAVQLFRAAADQGEAAARYALGTMYASGSGGLTKDPVEALRLFQLSAAQGYASAEYALGQYYLNGSGGLRKDRATALAWYRKAAAHGVAKATEKLRELHAN